MKQCALITTDKISILYIFGFMEWKTVTFYISFAFHVDNLKIRRTFIKQFPLKW